MRRCQEADRARSLSEELLLRLKSGTGDTWAGWLPEWAGYAQLHLAGAGAWGELLVDPARRRRGLGRHLLGACVASARERGARHLDVWCFGDSESGARLTAQLGFEPLRRLLFQTRALEGLPGLEPSEVILDAFDPARDVADWMALHRSVQADPARAWTEEAFRLRLTESWFDPALLRLARLGGRTLGYIWLKHHPLQTDGEVYMMAVSPEARGRGLGRWLVTWALHELAWRRASSAGVFVNASAQAAVRLYSSLGFQTHSADCCYRHELK